MRRRALAALLAAPLLLAACGGISPLRHRFEVGEDPYVLFAADGPEGAGDLYVVGPGGGRVVQVTFSPVDESAPALAPAGDVVAFLRRARADSVPQPWLLNLVNGAERKVPLPPGAGAPERLAWGVGGRELAIRTARGVWVTPAPPAPLALREAGAAERPGLDSLFLVRIGPAGFARADRCADGAGLCAYLADGRVSVLRDSAQGPARWGDDSVAYLVRGAIEVRPLRGGSARRLELDGAPPGVRELNYFGGVPRGRR